MHFFYVFRGVTLGGEKGLDRLVYDGDEGKNVSQRDVRRRLHSICLVLFDAGVAEGDFLLIVEPVLVVRAEAGVENPLFEAAIAFREVVRKRIAFDRARVPGEVGDAGDDLATPTLDDSPCLIA